MNSNNFFQLVAEFQKNIDWLNQVLKGNDSESVTIDGVVKPSISKDIEDKWSAIRSMVHGRLSFATKADMLKDTGQDENTLAEVWNDATESNNGLYGWDGSAWLKSPYSIKQTVDSQNTTSAVSGKAIFEYVKARKFNYFIATNYEIKITSDNKVLIPGFTFVYTGTGRVTINEGQYDCPPSHHFLVCDNDGNVSTKDAMTESDLYDFYIIAFSGPNSKTYVNTVQHTEYLIDSLENKIVLNHGEYIIFTDPGSYDAGGNVVPEYSGYHKELQIDNTGLFQVGWDLGGRVRYIHAVDESNKIIASWNGDHFSGKTDVIIDVPPQAKKMLLSSYGDAPRHGFFTPLPKARGELYGLISHDDVNDIVNKSTGSDEPPYIDINGNPWVDGKWKNANLDDVKSRVYFINDQDEYDLYYAPQIGYAQTISSIEINGQINTGDDLGAVTHNGATVNNLSADRDVVTVNEFDITRYTLTGFKFPEGSKRLIVHYKHGDTFYNGVRIYKRTGVKIPYRERPNANANVVVCGDSVSQNPETEIWKENIRCLLGGRVDTYGVGGAGWSINANPTWVTPRKVSGVYQVEELVKASSKVYDVYCLSCTLNDPITHNKDIGEHSFCKPYKKTGDDPDLTDPDLDTMLGALNFCIQRIYEKNPSAKIVLATMNKCFLTSPTNGFSVKAGYDPFDTSTNSHGKTYYEYVEAVRKLGEVWGVPVVDAYSDGGNNEFNKSTRMKDQYHPTELGYSGIWSQWLEKVINA